MIKEIEPTLTMKDTTFSAKADDPYGSLNLSRAVAVIVLLAPLLAACVSSSVPTDESLVAPVLVTQVKEKYKPLEVTSVLEAVESLADSSEREAGSYILGPGDSLTVVIQRVPNGAFDVTVRPDGYISLPIVDEVKVAGLTPAQLDDHLTALFSRRYVDPDLSVVVRSLRQPVVYVLGKVSRPGPILYHEASSAAEAIARAGDMMPSADAMQVTIIRLGDDGVIRPMTLNLEGNGKAFQYQAGAYLVLAATQLEPEDIIFVPERGSSRLGADLEQLFRPVNAVGGVLGSVLSPWVQWEVLKELQDNDNPDVSVPAGRR